MKVRSSPIATIIIAVIFAVLLSGCSISADVYSVVTGADGKTEFTGEATGYLDRTGTIDMSADNGTNCVGEFRYTGSKTGVGNMMCSNGESASFRFNALGMASGYGFGVSNKGSNVQFTYGLDERERMRYVQPMTPDEKERSEARAAEPNQGRRSQSSKRPATGELRPVGAGTGFFVANDGHMLTNAHVVDGCEKLRIKLPSKKIVDADLTAIDNRNDLALVKTAAWSGPIATFSKIDPRVGEEVVAFGFPWIGTLSSSGVLTQGTVNALSGLGDDIRFLQVSAEIHKGNSGGPLSDRYGNIVGINTQKLSLEYMIKRGEISQNLNFSLKSTFAKLFLRANQIEVAENFGSDELDTPTIAKALRDYTTNIFCYARKSKTAKK